MNQKKISNTILILIVVIVGVAGYFFLTKKSVTPTERVQPTDTTSLRQTPPVVEKVPTQTQIPSIQPPTPTQASGNQALPAPSLSNANETVNWKTYRNEKIKLEIKYPSSWVALTEDVNESQNNTIYYSTILGLWTPEKYKKTNTLYLYSTSPEIFISIIPNPDLINFEEWVSKKDLEFWEGPKKITLDSGVSGWLGTRPGIGDGDGNIYIQSPDKKHFIQIYYFPTSRYPDDSTLRNVINSFRFIQ